MTFHRSRVLASVGVAILAAGVLLGLLSTPASASSSPDPVAARAVRALIAGTAHEARAVFPGDFAAVLGYHPVVRAGVLVRPDGSCSSPVPLPDGFEPMCAQHDLGYDLLRYAEAKGEALGPWARSALDRRFGARLRSSCGDAAGPGCLLAAGTAYAVVQANSTRQGDGVPGPETAASVGAMVFIGSGAIVAVVGLLRRRLARALAGRLPAVPVSIMVGLAAAASLVPSVMPRPSWLQGVFTGLLMAAGYALGRMLPRIRLLDGGRARGLGLLAGAGVLAVSAWGLSSAGLLGLAQTRSFGPAGGWLFAAAVALAVGLVLAGVGHLVVATARRLFRRPAVVHVDTGQLFVRERIYGASLVAVGLLVALGNPVSAGVHAALTSPVGAGFFAAVGLDTADDNVLNRPSRVGAVRTYVAVDEADDAAGRAAIAVRRLEKQGGFERNALVLALPTGSGWVDPIGVRAVERRFAGDVATVAVQSTFLPSWAAMMVAREDNENGARQLVESVTDRLARIPAAERPRLYLIGQSLGVVAASAVDPDSAGARMVCGATWTGPPGGAIPDLPNPVVLANVDDPVVHWERSLAWHRPATYSGKAWLPAVSYLATGIDTIASLSAEVGHGHRYGPGQGLLLPDCADPGERVPKPAVPSI